MDTIIYALLTIANAALWVALAHIWDNQSEKEKDQ
jgi:hypothetical protein